MNSNMNIQAPSTLNLSGDKDDHKKWKTFRLAWENYEIATGLKKKDNEIRLATLSTIIGH